MYQLIYTSAPKLLEAGKTGFGTIARSKNLPQPLVMYLERISTLDRQAGISRYETYCSYKLGREVFHIFSHIADCGADYTGRTNHLAQHFIVEDGGAECELMGNSTPAGVLLGLQSLWLGKAWSEGPMWLPETPAPTNPVTEPMGAWLQHTGNQDNALWLNTYKLRSGACLRCDAETEAFVPLLHDAFLERADRGWGVGFSTVCASNISIQRFPMLCLGEEQARAHVSVPRGIPELPVNSLLTPPPDNEIIVEHRVPVEETTEPLPNYVPQNAPVVQTPCNQPVSEYMPQPPSVVQSSVPRPCARKGGRGKKSANNYLPAILLGIVIALLISFLLTGTDKVEKQTKPQSPAPESKVNAPKTQGNSSKQSQPASKPEQAIQPADTQEPQPSVQNADTPAAPASEPAKEEPSAAQQLKESVEEAKKSCVRPLLNVKDVDEVKNEIECLFSDIKCDSDLQKAKDKAVNLLKMDSGSRIERLSKSLNKLRDELELQNNPDASVKNEKRKELQGKIKDLDLNDVENTYKQIVMLREEVEELENWLEALQKEPEPEVGYIQELDGRVLCNLKVELLVDGKPIPNFQAYVFAVKNIKKEINIGLKVHALKNDKLEKKIRARIQEKHSKADDALVVGENCGCEQSELISIGDVLEKIDSFRVKAKDLLQKYKIDYVDDCIDSEKWDNVKMEVEKQFNEICVQRDAVVKKKKGDIAFPEELAAKIGKITGTAIPADKLRDEKEWGKIKGELSETIQAVFNLRAEIGDILTKLDPSKKYEGQLIIHVDADNPQRVNTEYKIVKKEGK